MAWSSSSPPPPSSPLRQGFRCHFGEPTAPFGSSRRPLTLSRPSFSRHSTELDENGSERIDSFSPDLLRPPLDRDGFRICCCAHRGASTGRCDSPFVAPFTGKRHGRRWVVRRLAGARERTIGGRGVQGQLLRITGAAEGAAMVKGTTVGIMGQLLGLGIIWAFRTSGSCGL
ncbi:hypothetical protein GQ457_07G000570 [Hibiscus cannabinus]